jgi:hypothetical protein
MTLFSMAMGALMATTGIAPEQRAAILDAARAPAAAFFARPVKFRVDRLTVVDDWAFLSADMQDGQGRPIDYAGTPLADAAAHGAVSRSYAALLRRAGRDWRVVDHAIGPTDVVWADWPGRHGAPAALFAGD